MARRDTNPLSGLPHFQQTLSVNMTAPSRRELDMRAEREGGVAGLDDYNDSSGSVTPIVLSPLSSFSPPPPPSGSTPPSSGYITVDQANKMSAPGGGPTLSTPHPQTLSTMQAELAARGGVMFSPAAPPTHYSTPPTSLSIESSAANSETPRAYSKVGVVTPSNNRIAPAAEKVRFYYHNIRSTSVAN